MDDTDEGMELQRALGAQIAARRQAQGWTQAELAERADVQVQALQRTERGEAYPRPATLVRVAQALAVEPGDLFPRTGEEALTVEEASLIGSWRTLEGRDRSVVRAVLRELTK